VAGLAVLLCLIPGLAVLSQDVTTTTEIAFGLTIGGTFTPLSSLPSDPVVGQEVTVVWQVTAQTSSEVTDWDAVSLSRQLKSPGSQTWDLLDDTVAPGEGENDENWIKWTYKFTPEVAGTYTAEGSYSDCGDCAPPLEASSSGSETVSVDKANTTTSLYLDPATSVTGQSVTLTATVAPSIPAPVGSPPAPTGTVTFSVGATLLGSEVLDPVTGKAEITTSSIPLGTQTITAQYAGDDGYNASSGTEEQTVNKADTELTLSTVPDPSVSGQPVTLTADVETVLPGGGSPTGTVTFTVGATFLGSAGLVSTGANASQAEITTSLLPAGTQTITAQYGGDADYNGDSDTEDHTTTKRTTTTTVFGSSTPLVVGDTVTCTVTVTGTPPGEAPMPTGTVTVGVSPTGQGSPVSWSHPLVAADAGQFTFTYTPSSAATTTHTFTATYPGDITYDESTGDFAQAIIKRAADVLLACNPTTAYIFQDVACLVHVEDDTTAGMPAIPTGTVTLSDGGKNGIFTVGGMPAVDDTWLLDGAGDCTVTYTPAAWDAGTTTITATYNGSSAHSGKSTTQLLTVDLRPTQTQVLGSSPTLLVNQLHTGGTVDVTDIAGVGTSTPPVGTLSYSSSLPVGYATISPTTGLAPSDTFAYRCHGLDAAAGFDTIRADYTANDGIHANSAGAFGQGVQRRPTETTLSGCASTPTGCTCTATVTEKAGIPGDAVPIAGNLEALSPDTTFSGAAPSWFVTTTTDAFIGIVSVSFEPTNKVHLASTALANVNRSDEFPDEDPDPNEGSGADCDDGCGSGGRNVDEIIKGINIAEVTLTAVQMGLETFATVLDVIPDVIVGGGVFVISGVTIPISDIVAAVISGAGIAIDIAITAMTTDIDGDGIPDVVELTLGTDPYNVDSDGDGMGDADEISEAGGWCGGSRRPNPLVPDSDGDGLLDGEEGQYGTSVCVADTDCDTVSDGDEVGTWVCSDPRNHADPLFMDTDGDGLDDNLEFSAGPGCNSCPYVNDDDSDDDGLQDGYEDKNGDGSITNTIGRSTSQGSGETDFCNPDTDGDGLLDGEEEGLFGQGAVTAVTPTGAVTTIPALDDDSDNDGLSDWEEVNVTGTNPLHWDTDGDGVSDANELIATGGGWPKRTFHQESDPLDRDTDDDGLSDYIEWGNAGLGTGLGITRTTGGTRDTICPFVNDDDSDDDGLQDGYEDKNRDGSITNTIGRSTSQGSGETDFCNPDTDLDGLLDGEEEALFGQGAVTAVTPTGAVTTIPALDDDSDNDGLSDWEEVNVTGTNPLHWDTDGDGIGDADELIATGGAWPKRTFIQESDPLDPDTDDDGLPDAIEYPGTGLGSTYLRGLGGNPDTICPFVNDDDSDDDGLQDGYEDKNKDGIWNNYQIGNSTTQGWGETCACNPDSDGDGLSDGEEEGLLGRTATPQGVSTVPGVDGAALGATTPALDDDSDNDGLSDWEEVNDTGTDPLDADTDNDTLSDADELIATGGAWPKRKFIQESDPLDPDTDDDELPDAIEYPGTGLGSTYLRSLGGNPDTICPFVNDDDSDDDGLQDGYEDKNRNGIWDEYGLGDSTSEGWGETCACNPDSDGDGLSDGEEEGLLGRTAIPQGVSTVLPMGTSTPPPGYIVLAGSMRGTGNDLLAPYLFTPAPGPSLPQTVPALDTDSDNDGLSDYEEVHITGTDPLDADTDNDTLADADELIAVDGTWPKRQFDQVSDPLSTNTDGDHLFDPQEFAGSGLSALAGGLGGMRDLVCPYVNDADSDDDGVQDGAVVSRTFVAVGVTYSWTHYEDFADIPPAGVAWPGIVRTLVTPAGGEQNDDTLCNVCDADSDGDGLGDGEEISIGTDPGDWDTDDDGRNDWHEVTGGGPIPTDPFDPDTDDDGLLDSAEVFGSNPTNPANCDTDGDGLCDGGNRTPYMTTPGQPGVAFNPRCITGIGGHPNPLGIGENERGDGARHPDETDPNNPDTDGDAVGDGIERLSFSVSRQYLIPATDLFGRPITVVYPEANNIKPVCGCMDPLNPDSDGDGLLDGEEDLNHDGHFDFLVSDFDHGDHPIPGPPIPHRMETNPCDPDTDHDGLTDWEELRGQANPPAFFPFNPTNPLDHDTDNDWLLDGEEVYWVCVAIEYFTLDNDTDGLIDEDPIDGIDNDGDGLIDEDPVDFWVRFVPMLDPTNRDSDSDGYIDGLDEDPCNSELIPVVSPAVLLPVDSDGDGFADDDEEAAGTDPNDPEDYPAAYCAVDVDFDGLIDDRIWLEPGLCCGEASAVVIDLDSNLLIDLRIAITSRSIKRGDFDKDGYEDDIRYTVEYVLSNYRAVQLRGIATIDDYNSDLVIDWVVVERK